MVVLSLALAGCVALLVRVARPVPKEVAAPPASVVAPSLLQEMREGRTGARAAAFPSAADPRAAATVWAVGDGATGTDDARRLARTIAAGSPRRVLYLGDVYESGTAEEFRAHFAGVYGGLVPIMAPTPGNHEWGNRAEGYDAFWRARTGHPTPHWYAFTIGGWRIVSLSSEIPRDADQLAFVRRELAARADRCVIAMLHQPRESAGSHGDASSVEPLWRELRGRVPVVLSGHEHNLQRLRPVSGTVQYIVGAGGRARYGVKDRDPRLDFARDDLDGALRLRLRPGRADLDFVATSAATLDRSSARCAE